MLAVSMLARSELRHRWRSALVLTLLVGFVGAVVLALVGGARRTETSLARFETFSRSARLEVDVGDATPDQIAELLRVPGVVAIAQLYQLVLIRSDDENLAVAGQVDDTFGTEVDRARVVEGRAADPAAPLELNIGESFAEAHHLRVGDRARFASYSLEDVALSRANNAAVPHPTGPAVDFRIVGIVRRPLDLGSRGTAGGVIVPTPAFVAQYRDQIGSYAGSLLRVRTEGASDVPRVTRAARRIFGSSPVFSFTSLSIEGKGAQDAIDVTTVGLYLAAAVAGLTGLVGVGIALSREIALVDTDQLTLSALGLRPRHRTAAAAAVGVPVAFVGALLAVLGAALASPLFPIGVGRDAEPDPGFRLDGSALVVGVVAIVAVVLVLAVLAGVRTARATRSRLEPARPATPPRVAAELGASPPVVAGVQFALDRGHSRRALPVWSSLLGAIFGLTVICAVLVFGASLDHLASRPSAYGWTWDITAGDTAARQVGENDCSPVTTRLVHERVVTAVASICNGNVEIGGRPVASWGFGHIKGDIEPGIVAGRAPRAVDEVALGADTLAAAGRDIGDRVVVRGPKRTLGYHIVGQSVFPSLSDPEPFADGAAFSAAGLARLGDGDGGWDLVVRLRPGTDLPTAVRALRPITGASGTPLTATLPAEIERVRRIESLPVALAAFVSVVALVAVGFALVTAVRRRRRDLAVLKTLGFSRRQVRATVAWHASIVGAIGLVVGIPLGLIVGRVVWHAVADELGVATDPTGPWLGIAVLVPLSLLAVNLIAALPARAAARTRPALVLRSE
jgi:hypothetical protein